MEKNEQSRIPDPDEVVSPDDPNDPVVTTDDPNTCALLTNTLKEIRSTCAFVTNTLKEIRAEQEKTPYGLGSSFRRRDSIRDPNYPMEPTNEQSGTPDPELVMEEGWGLEGCGGALYDDREVDRPNNTRSKICGETEIEIKQLEKLLGRVRWKNIHQPVSQCCIYKVPQDLCKINEEAYTPQIISIGPFHQDNFRCLEMEKQKIRYMLEFHKREGAQKLEEFKRYIEANEKDIRNYYQENSSLHDEENSSLHYGHGPYGFVNMILCDAVFIIEFFLKNVNAEGREFDFFLDTTCVKAAITRDLQLLENQLPYFHLKKLFEIGAFHNFTKDYPDRDPFLILCHRFFFGNTEPNNEIQQCEIQHFTDLRRHFLLMDFLPQDQNQGKHVRDLPTATKLHGSGVKFKKGIEGGSSLEISCKPVPRTMRIPGFKGLEIRIPFTKTLELQIPRLEIDDRSECLYRNMMALELCHYPSKTHICNFMLLMDFLINTEKDVDLFVEEGIIFSLLGDNAAVSNMFNNLGLQITPSFSVYHDIGEKLKAHYARPWNRTMANLNTVYFGDIWKGTATIAAVILLVLTFVQTIFPILSLF